MVVKTIPVWLHQGPDQKIQIGVAGEVDPDTNAQSIEIWDEFKEYKIDNYTIGNAETPQSAAQPAPQTREEIRKANSKEEKS